MNDHHLAQSLLVGSSRAMRAVREEVATVAPSGLSVLVEGETGTGKENVARAIHLLSSRAGNFVPINVCAISEALFESEMFGHERGAFTGAVATRRGRFVEADRGTLFLDELAGLGLTCQAKLLRAIESGVVRPVGGVRDATVSARFVSASNVPLGELVSAERFRDDLAFRLTQWRIVLPPLAERREDIPELVRSFQDNGINIASTFAAGALDELAALPWPGNVRQLRSFVQVLQTLRPHRIDREDLRQLWERTAWHSPAAAPAPNVEKDELLAVLAQHGWCKESVSKELGVHLSTLYRRMSRLGIKLQRSRLSARSADVARSIAQASLPS